MIDDRRERPWKKLRVVVEVTVPPASRATEKDLIYMVEAQLERSVVLPRPTHRDGHVSAVRVKSFTRFWPWFLKKERGLSIRKPNKDNTRHDENNGL